MRQLMSTFCLFMTMVSCDLPHLQLHPYADYLNESVGRADHDAVAMKMGAPHRTVPLDKGGDLWTYDFCQHSGPGGTTFPNCQHVNLIFDGSGKLVQWHDK
jgi:hypothetical protein